MTEDRELSKNTETVQSHRKQSFVIVIAFGGFAFLVILTLSFLAAVMRRNNRVSLMSNNMASSNDLYSPESEVTTQQLHATEHCIVNDLVEIQI